MVSVTLRLRCLPHALLGLFAVALLLAGCSGAATQQAGSAPPAPPTPLSVATTSLPDGEVNAPYRATLAAAGGTAPYTWSLTGGAFPAGLALEALSGAITGTPTAGVSAAALTFEVTDSGSPAQTSTVHLSLTVTAALLIATTTLPNGQIGVPYSATLSASGGTAPYTWTLSGGTPPAGLALNGATGVLSGTPTAVASATALTFTVTDAAAPPQHTSTALALSIGTTAPPPAPTVTTTSLPNGVEGKPYAATLAASGGSAPYSWKITAGTLPAGLQLSAAGSLAGTPTASVSGSELTVTVTDANAQSGSANLALTVAAVLGITTTTLPNGVTGQAYSATLAASGGAGAYSWTLTGGTLPAGLSLAATGLLSGKPTATAAATPLTFRVTDAGTAQTATKTLALTVTAASAVTITTTSLPTGFTGKLYSASLKASGGTGSYTWALTGGALPAGMALNPRTGGLSGVPTAIANAVALTFTATDGNGVQSAPTTLPITILAGLSVSSTGLPNGQVGVAYSAALAASGGTSPYSWALSGGALPAGLNIASNGTISGTPTASANGTTVTFTVTDSGNPQQTASASLLLTVSPAGITVSIAPGRAGLTVTQALTLSATTNDNAGVTWSIAPAGGAFSPATSPTGADVTFTAPSSAGVYTLTATSVTDPTRSASITVGVTDLAGVYTAHNDPSRTGANTREYALTKALVSTTTFGKLFACPVDGAIYAQPLWVANQTVAGVRHNMVFVATEHDSLYAFDADSSPCAQLWKASLIDLAHGAAAAGETSVPAGTAATGFKVGIGLGNLQPEAGVSGTPVIDPATNILYVVSKSMNAAGTTFYQRLHAIDLITGNEKAGAPVTIGASFPGSFTAGTSVAFNPQPENQRAGLALANGSVYIAWGSHEDAYPWLGWVIGYAYVSGQFTQTGVFLATPNTGRGGIWMGGGAPAVDDAGNLYLLTGNGPFDATSGTAPNNDYGDSFLRLGPALAVNSWFTPSDEATDNTGDKDFGSGGSSVLLNNPSGTIKHLVIGGGKDGALYVLNGDSMGGLGDSFAHQMFTVGSGIFSTPAFWNDTLYIAPVGGTMFTYAFNPANNTFTTTFGSRSNVTFKFPGATPSVSASGSSNGLVWALDNSLYCTGQSPGCGPAVLHALDASNLASEAWNSSSASPDAAGNAVKYTVPTIANGKVYIGTRGNNTGGVFGSSSVSGELDVYGLKP